MRNRARRHHQYYSKKKKKNMYTHAYIFYFILYYILFHDIKVWVYNSVDKKLHNHIWFHQGRFAEFALPYKYMYIFHTNVRNFYFILFHQEDTMLNFYSFITNPNRVSKNF